MAHRSRNTWNDDGGVCGWGGGGGESTSYGQKWIFNLQLQLIGFTDWGLNLKGCKSCHNFNLI